MPAQSVTSGNRISATVSALSAPVEALIERLTTRDTNPYGKDPSDVAETLKYLETVERVADLVLAQVLTDP